jgi:hypothetical protein
MALIFSDPNSAGPFASFQIKDVVTKVFKLPYSLFVNGGGTPTLLGRLPADASIIRISTWVETALAGNTVSAPTLSLGTASSGTQFTSALAITNTVKSYVTANLVTGILQAYQQPLGADINLWALGDCTSGPPTSGLIYLIVEYVR